MFITCSSSLSRKIVPLIMRSSPLANTSELGEQVTAEEALEEVPTSLGCAAKLASSSSLAYIHLFQ
jgi:hypothetical protein